jgi:glycosyltransferase involved in cell wall biosynthesis
MRLSVIIPVYNDQDRLIMCLRALEAQTLAAEDFEVIAVDNGSREPIAVETASNTRIVTELRPGSYAARNTGVEHATGTVIAFTDADCIPDPTWLSEGLTYLDDHPDVSRVGGRVEIFAQDPDHRTPAELYESVHGFPQEQYVTNRGFAATANLLVRNSVFEVVGPFDADLRSGGDVEFGQRSTDMGHTLDYLDAMLVRHPARRTLKELSAKQQRTIAGARDLAISSGEPTPYPLSAVLRSMIPPLPTMMNGLRNTDIGPMADRVKFTYATLFSHYAKALFKFRLLLGARSPR